MNRKKSAAKTKKKHGGKDSPQGSTPPWRRVLVPVLKLLSAAGLIYWIIQKGALDLKALSIALEPKALLVLGSLSIAGLIVNNGRWLLLLRGQGLATTTAHTFPLTLIGMFFNFAMPGSVGGDIIKGYYLTQDFPEQKVAAAVSVFMDRIIGFFVMMLSASIAILFFHERLSHDPRLMAIGTGTFVITAGFIAVLAISLSRRVQRRLKFLSQWLKRLPGHAVLEEIYRAMHSYRYRVRDLFAAMGLSMLTQVFLILFFFVTAQLLGETEIPLATFWFCIPIGLVIQSVPIAPAGIGVGQAAFYFLFEAALRHPSQVGTVGITLLQAFQFLVGLIGAFYYLKRGKPKSHVEQGEL